jgi:hypothetical protein
VLIYCRHNFAGRNWNLEDFGEAWDEMKAELEPAEVKFMRKATLVNFRHNGGIKNKVDYEIRRKLQIRLESHFNFSTLNPKDEVFGKTLQMLACDPNKPLGLRY